MLNRMRQPAIEADILSYHFPFVFRVLARVSQIFSFVCVWRALSRCRARWQITNECSDAVRFDWYANWHFVCDGERKRLTRVRRKGQQIFYYHFSLFVRFSTLYLHMKWHYARAWYALLSQRRWICSPLARLFFFFGPNQVANGAATSDNERSLFNKRTSSSSFSPQ